MVFSLERFVRWYLSFLDIAKVSYPKELKEIIKAKVARVKL